MKKRNTRNNPATLASIETNSLYNNSLARAIDREERAAAAAMAEEIANAAELAALCAAEDVDVDAEIDAMTASEFAILAEIEKSPAYRKSLADAIAREEARA